MHPSILILSIFAISAAAVGSLALWAFRAFIRRYNLEAVTKEGVTLAEDGIEALRLFWIGKVKLSYSEIESIKVLPSIISPSAMVLFPLARWVGTRPFHK